MIKIGFIGLGKMGYNIASNLNKHFETYVWNRTLEISDNHSKEYRTISVKDLESIPNNCKYIFFCLPTSKEVKQIIDKISYLLNDSHILIDCTSSDFQVQKKIFDILKEKNIFYFDAPVSGGPEKALNGTLTCMVGGDKNKYDDIENILKTFSKPIYVGNIGNACAIKSINNILNVSHLCLAAEALKSLNDIGISKELALEVINNSSGRSLMTQERIPNDILKKNYNYGFSLGLMKKDVNLALNLIKNPIMFNNISSLLEKSVDKYGYNADYTEIAKLFFN